MDSLDPAAVGVGGMMGMDQVRPATPMSSVQQQTMMHPYNGLLTPFSPVIPNQACRWLRPAPCRNLK